MGYAASHCAAGGGAIGICSAHAWGFAGCGVVNGHPSENGLGPPREGVGECEGALGAVVVWVGSGGACRLWIAPLSQRRRGPVNGGLCSWGWACQLQHPLSRLHRRCQMPRYGTMGWQHGDCVVAS